MKYSFRKGYRQLTIDEAPAVREEIIDKLGIKRTAFYSRLRGEVEPKVSEYLTIERIFKKRGISEIWG